MKVYTFEIRALHYVKAETEEEAREKLDVLYSGPAEVPVLVDVRDLPDANY